MKSVKVYFKVVVHWVFEALQLYFYSVLWIALGICTSVMAWLLPKAQGLCGWRSCGLFATLTQARKTSHCWSGAQRHSDHQPESRQHRGPGHWCLPCFSSCSLLCVCLSPQPLLLSASGSESVRIQSQFKTVRERKLSARRASKKGEGWEWCELALYWHPTVLPFPSWPVSCCKGDTSSEVPEMCTKTYLYGSSLQHCL